MTPEIAKLLRAPFPPEKIGKLPRVTCGDCKDSRGRVCDKHAKSRCDECASYITSAHMHLDFVGHADTTDRLLEADPEWMWEPFALDPRGLPAIDDNGGMWIRLTVAGVTRIGYGDADGKRGGAAVKETIGDAIRNASMRFGVALDLWRKETHIDESTGPRRRQNEPDERRDPSPRALELFAQITEAATPDALRGAWDETNAAGKAADITAGEVAQLKAHITRRGEELAKPAEPQAGEAAMVTQAQHRRMHALWRDLKLGGDEHREQRLTRTSVIVGRDIESSADLTEAEAVQVIRALVAEVQPAEVTS